MPRASRQIKRQLERACTIERVAAWENLVLAARKARRRKSRRPDVEAWWIRREEHLERLAVELQDGTWRPGGYRLFQIREPKRRTIAAAPFGDRVVHHALCNVMQPLLERRFIARSFSCQIGKGTTAAREVCRVLTNRYRYVVKCDARKFFPSIDHRILRAKLTKEIACAGVMGIIDRILASYRTDGAEIPPDIFPGDDWAEVVERPRGLPIGNLTSQLWGNFFLDALDHRITEIERHGAYLRYTDDALLFGDDKARLWSLWDIVREELASIRLKLAMPKTRLLAAAEGVPFCGMRFLPGLRPRILGATKRRFEKRRHRLAKDRLIPELSLATFSWYQFSREANSEGLRQAYSRPRPSKLATMQN